MPHMIENNEIAWVGRRPWHGFGNEVKRGATGLEMLKAAHLNWRVELRDIAFMLPGVTGNMIDPLAKFKAVTRSDTDRVFTVATTDFNPVQNEDVVDFFREFCEAGHADVETVGALRGGAIVWCLAKLKGLASRLILGDLVEGYLFIATAHDCSMQTIARATQIRIVCWNTLSAALRERGGSRNQFRCSHTRKWTPEVAEEARRTVGMAVEALGYTNAVCEKLAAVPLDDAGFVEYMELLMGKDNVKDEKGVLKPTATAIWTARDTSPGADVAPAKGTLYGALNAVTYYADWVRGRTDETRVRGSFFGDGERMKNDALEAAMELAGVRG
jgi:phage/plasmid-like protein (TIGR03299 family)